MRMGRFLIGISARESDHLARYDMSDSFHHAKQSHPASRIPHLPAEDSAARRMPAEWEPHDATWIGWPHHRPDWPGKFEPIPWVYAEIVRVLHAHERVEVLCNGVEARDQAVRALRAHDVNMARVGLHLVPTDRVWLRDSGPTAVAGPDGSITWVAWRFNAWAKYENYRSDELVAQRVAELSGLPLVKALRPDGQGRLVLEGGGIETDGSGTLLVTEEWLVSR